MTNTDNHHDLKLVINDKNYQWKEQYITRSQICKLGSISEDSDVFLCIVKPYKDELVKDFVPVDLARPGIEHFYSKEKHHHYTIIVNAEQHKVITNHVTYDEVVIMAFPDFPHHPERTYSVTYKRGPHSNPEGILSPGGKVKVKNDMTFTVKHTGQS